jgi:hypothetical protein
MSGGGDHQKEPSYSHPPKIGPVDPGAGHETRRKLNPRWWPPWMSGGADHRKEPSSSHPMSHRKIGSIDPGICPPIDGNYWVSGGADHRKEPSSSHPMSHRKIGSIDPGICPPIDGN